MGSNPKHSPIFSAIFKAIFFLYIFLVPLMKVEIKSLSLGSTVIDLYIYAKKLKTFL